MGKRNQIKIGGIYQYCRKLYLWDRSTNKTSSVVLGFIDLDETFVLIDWEYIPETNEICCRVLTETSLVGYIDVIAEDLKLANNL